LQGVILQYGTRLIDSAGDYVDELLRPCRLGADHEYPWILRKPVYVTFTTGAVALYDVGAVLKCIGDKLFLDELFAYYDDVVLGLMLWSCGFSSISIPKVVAYHARGSTLRRKGSFGVYLFERNRIAIALISNTRYKHMVFLHTLRNIVTATLKTELDVSKIEARALADGLELGKLLRSRGIFIDLYKAPIMRVEPKDLIYYFTSRRMIARYREEWAIKNLHRFVVE
jgi:GT2 family glycosyltransferase